MVSFASPSATVDGLEWPNQQAKIVILKGEDMKVVSTSKEQDHGPRGTHTHIMGTCRVGNGAKRHLAYGIYKDGKLKDIQPGYGCVTSDRLARKANNFTAYGVVTCTSCCPDGLEVLKAQPGKAENQQAKIETPKGGAMECNCYVNDLPAAERFGIRYGAHQTDCPVYRESLDPVDRKHDEGIRQNHQALRRIDMPTIERIQDVTLSNGRVIINKLGRTYSVTTFDHDNETTHTPGLTYAEAMHLSRSHWRHLPHLINPINPDVLETNEGIVQQAKASRPQTFFVTHSMERSLTYGVAVWQVWSYMGHASSGSKDTLKYETSSRAKAKAVCEYLTLAAEQAHVDQFRTPDIKGTFVPRSINA